MDKHNEPETIAEMLASHGIAGAPADRLERDLCGLIRAEASRLRYGLTDFRAIEAVKRLEKRLTTNVPPTADSEEVAS